MVGFHQFVYRSGRLLSSLVQWGCMGYCASYLATPRICNGDSMVPTLYDNDIVVSEAISAMKCQLKRGDIVVVKGKTDPHQYLCKRLVAMEFDRVFNNKTGQHVQVPKGHVWLEGDNQECSLDSREVGAFPYALVRERVYYCARTSALPHPSQHLAISDILRPSAHPPPRSARLYRSIRLARPDVLPFSVSIRSEED